MEAGNRHFKCTKCNAAYDQAIPALTQTTLTECNVILSYDSATYNGKEKKPEVTVKNGADIVPSSEYTVAYADNVNAGTAKAIITAAGGDTSITGEKTATFEIGKAKQALTANLKKESLHVGTTGQIAVDGIGAFAYETSNVDIAEVSEAGVVTGKAAGTAVITVTAAGNSNYESATTEVMVPVDAHHKTTTSIENKVTQDNGDITYDEVTKCTICNDEIKRTNKTIYSCRKP